MLNSGEKYTKIVSSNNRGHIPDEIKVHTENKVKIVPDENKTHSGNASMCRIVPSEKIPDMETELRDIGIPLDNGEKIKIVPPINK